MATVVNAGLTCYAFALACEHAVFRRQADIRTPLDADVRGWRGERGLVVETGIGAANVRRALETVADRYAPARYLFAGYAGALRDDLRVGDVRAASCVLAPNGERFEPMFAMPGIPVATFFTASHLVGEPDAKRRLAAEHAADMVDMESAHFAQWCLRRGVPWACVRVVSDAVETRLSPELVRLMSGGRVAVMRVLGSLLRRPSLLREMLRLARDTKHASKALATAMCDSPVRP